MKKKTKLQPDTNFFWIVTGVAMLLAALPFLIGAVIGPKGFQFLGQQAMAAGDSPIYFSYIEQGRHGALLMYDAFTSEAHRATLFQPIWLVIGLFAAFFHLSTPIAYFAARILLVPLLWGTMWWAIKWLFTEKIERRTALLLASFGAGVGALASYIVPTATDFTGYHAPDQWVTEMFPLLSAMATPHFLLVTSGLLFMIFSVERATEEHSWRRIWWAGAAAFITFSIHPFHVVTLAVLWAALTILRWWKVDAFPREFVAKWLTVLGFSLPVFVYYAWQLTSDQLFIGRAAQNILQTQSPLRMILALGVFLPLAAYVVWKQWQKNEKIQWLATWAATYIFVIYLPFSFQRRLSHAMILPFAWLAVPVVVKLWRWLQRQLFVTQMVVMIVSIFLTSFSLLWGMYFISHSYVLAVRGVPQHMYYLAPEQQSLVKFLKSSPKHEPVLSTVTNGNVLGGLSAHQMFVGYGVETLQFPVKAALVQEFFGVASQPRQRQILKDWNLCYVLYTPRERAIGSAFVPQDWPDMQPVWQGKTMTLYQTAYCR